MSTAAGPAYRPRPSHDPRPDPRRLRAVGQAQRVRRLPFIILAALIVVAGVLGLLSLNVNVNQQAFAIAELERANRDAENRYATLQADIDRLKAPDRIALQAARQHLVPAGRPRVSTWPGSKPGGATSPGAATSPAAPGAGSAGDPNWASRDSSGSPDDQAWPQDPFPLKRYLAEP
jgi:Tfp pilus assembly protein PilV